MDGSLGVPGTEPLAMAAEPSALMAMTAGIERQLQMVQARSSGEDSGLKEVDQVSAGLRADQREASEVAELQKMLHDLQNQNQLQAGQLHKALEQQRLTSEAIGNSQMELQLRAVDVDRARTNEQKARQSEQKAWEVAKKAAHERRTFETVAQHAKETLEAKERQLVLQQRAWEITNKNAQRDKKAVEAHQQEHRAWELATLQARRSEQKAWELAKSQADKATHFSKEALAERQAREAVLAAAKAELSDIKNEVNEVQEQAAKELHTEVEQAREASTRKVEEANAELRKASGQLQREHDEVKSVVTWAKSVQQEADKKLRWAALAQEQATNQANWATATQREAATAATAMQRVAQAQLKNQARHGKRKAWGE
jgi:hypothetical protein